MISIFPCLHDNYGFLLHEPSTGLTACIDTPDGSAILKQCEKLSVTLTHIFNTHHHFDHVDGNAMLKKQCGVTIIGPKADEDRIPGIDIRVSDGDIFNFGQYEIHVFHTPGHTKGHCVYYVPNLGSIFVGDTLFALGCGRLFEGTPEQMFNSLAKITSLPDETQVYCAHEYTLKNADFALTVEPENFELRAYIKNAKALRAKNKPTIPTTIGKEKNCNPFVRARTPDILKQIRKARDGF